MKKEYKVPSLKVLAYEAEQDVAILSANGNWAMGDELPKDDEYDDDIFA